MKVRQIMKVKARIEAKRIQRDGNLKIVKVVKL